MNSEQYYDKIIELLLMGNRCGTGFNIMYLMVYSIGWIIKHRTFSHSVWFILLDTFRKRLESTSLRCGKGCLKKKKIFKIWLDGDKVPT